MSCIYKLIYISSIAFQLSGALLLLIGSFTNTKKKVVDEYIGYNALRLKYPAYEIDLDIKKVSAILQSLYINRIAFIYLSLGYISIVFAKTPIYEAWKTTVIILFLATLFIIIGFIIAKIISSKNQNLKSFVS